MYFTFEISRPIQWKPGCYKSKLTKRVWWLYVAIGYHPLREDELYQKIKDGLTVWGK